MVISVLALVTVAVKRVAVQQIQPYHRALSVPAAPKGCRHSAEISNPHERQLGVEIVREMRYVETR
jgi:hypothetical protein